MKIENSGDVADTLYKAECDFAGRVEIHETYQTRRNDGYERSSFIVIPPNQLLN